MISELTKWSVAVGVAVLLALIGDIRAPNAGPANGDRPTAARPQSTVDLAVNGGAATSCR